MGAAGTAGLGARRGAVRPVGVPERPPRVVAHPRGKGRWARGLRGQPQREGAGRAVLWGAHGDAKVTREVTQKSVGASEGN